MMQAAEARERNNLAELRRLYRAMVRRVLGQRQVHSVLVVPGEELGK
jgi:hypothetical protein